MSAWRSFVGAAHWLDPPQHRIAAPKRFEQVSQGGGERGRTDPGLLDLGASRPGAEAYSYDRVFV